MTETNKELKLRLKQMVVNCNFLIQQIDKVHLAFDLPSGTWQQRAEMVGNLKP